MLPRTVHCGACGYDLAGLTGAVCPECGGAFVDAKARRVAAVLIEGFRDGLVPNAELLDAWPLSPADPTVAAAFHDLNTQYRDYRVAHLGAAKTPDRDRRERLTRWVAFLRIRPGRQTGAYDPINTWYPFEDEPDYWRNAPAAGDADT